MFSRLRKPKTLQVPLRFRATCNPGGQYGEFYHRRFFLEGEENGRIFIGAGLSDNPYLDADEYRQALAELDPVTREQLENGNWEIKEAGDMFSRLWFNIVPFNQIPANARRVRFWDLASTDPKKRKSKDKRDPDWSVGFKLAEYQGIYYVEDIVRVQKKPAEVEEIMAATTEHDGYSCMIRMEQEPGSSGVITTSNYARGLFKGYDFMGVSSTGSKSERARAASSAAQMGNIVISNKCRNVSPFFDELDVFPFGLHDDTVDGLSGAYTALRQKTVFSAPTGIRKKSGSRWRENND
jgi:predicted phage terminase large subunit-like protein